MNWTSALNISKKCLQQRKKKTTKQNRCPWFSRVAYQIHMLFFFFFGVKVTFASTVVQLKWSILYTSRVRFKNNCRILGFHLGRMQKCNTKCYFSVTFSIRSVFSKFWINKHNVAENHQYVSISSFISILFFLSSWLFFSLIPGEMDVSAVIEVIAVRSTSVVT